MGIDVENSFSRKFAYKTNVNYFIIGDTKSGGNVMNNSVSEISRMWEQTLELIDQRLDERQIFDSFFSRTYIHIDKMGRILGRTKNQKPRKKRN